MRFIFAVLLFVLTHGVSVASETSWKALTEQALTVYRQGDPQRAIELTQHALLVAKAEFGAESLETAESMGNLAALYRVQSPRLRDSAARIREQRGRAPAPSGLQSEIAAVGSVNKIFFGLIAPRGVETTTNNWRPFADALAARLQIPIELVVRDDVKEIVELFKAGKLDLAWLGNTPALEVVEARKGAVFARMITKTGSSSYRSVLIVHKDSNIQTLEDVLKLQPLDGLVFGDGDAKSTSGHVVPLYYAFVKNKINDPATLFKEIKSANHRTNLLRTAQKEVDVATNNTEEMDFFSKDSPDLSAQLRVIWTSPEIPQSPLVWRNSLPAALKRQIGGFVTSYGKNSEAERKVLMQANELSGFSRSSNRQLTTIADLELFNKWLKLWNDKTSLPEERKRQERELSERGGHLELYLRMSKEEY
ncbi:MAG: phosphate/phosphite/phosphonate ABC transporter substrate-binding protein [Gammaproteobacteria bacterium]|nr:phosphate/phosphite/phosphonate ABC transporter substrate-binding protein [Gammaproteobacteria bacterium]